MGIRKHREWCDDVCGTYHDAAQGALFLALIWCQFGGVVCVSMSTTAELSSFFLPLLNLLHMPPAAFIMLWKTPGNIQRLTSGMECYQPFVKCCKTCLHLNFLLQLFHSLLLSSTKGSQAFFSVSLTRDGEKPCETHLRKFIAPILSSFRGLT